MRKRPHDIKEEKGRPVSGLPSLEGEKHRKKFMKTRKKWLKNLHIPNSFRTFAVIIEKHATASLNMKLALLPPL